MCETGGSDVSPGASDRIVITAREHQHTSGRDYRSAGRTPSRLGLGLLVTRPSHGFINSRFTSRAGPRARKNVLKEHLIGHGTAPPSAAWGRPYPVKKRLPASVVFQLTSALPIVSDHTRSAGTTGAEAECPPALCVARIPSPPRRMLSHARSPRAGGFTDCTAVMQGAPVHERDGSLIQAGREG
jgi:hypothetical protein